MAPERDHRADELIKDKEGILCTGEQPTVHKARGIGVGAGDGEGGGLFVPCLHASGAVTRNGRALVSISGASCLPLLLRLKMEEGGSTCGVVKEFLPFEIEMESFSTR